MNVSLLPYLLPNFDKSALVALAFVVVGAVFIVLSLKLWWVRDLSEALFATGIIVVLVGLAYWFLASLISDVWSNTKLRWVIICGFGVIVFAYLLFREPKKQQKKRVRRKKK